MRGRFDKRKPITKFTVKKALRKGAKETDLTNEKESNNPKSKYSERVRHKFNGRKNKT